MPWILLTNDDGIDSPALGPFAEALGEIGDVRIVVPDGERSWSGKAITRFGEIAARSIERFGVPTLAISGFPADAVQIGAVAFDQPPSMVVSGINLGFNHGAGYLLGSGTVGAAAEGWQLGLPSFAFSAGSEGEWKQWHAFASSVDSTPHWRRLAEVCTDLLREVRSGEMPGDIVNINVPWASTAQTPVRVTSIAKVAYGRLHSPNGSGTFVHDYRQDFTVHEPLAGTDVEVNRAGEISITPVLMPTAHEVPTEIRARLERG